MIPLFTLARRLCRRWLAMAPGGTPPRYARPLEGGGAASTEDEDAEATAGGPVAVPASSS